MRNHGYYLLSLAHTTSIQEMRAGAAEAQWHNGASYGYSP